MARKQHRLTVSTTTNQANRYNQNRPQRGGYQPYDQPRFRGRGFDSNYRSNNRQDQSANQPNPQYQQDSRYQRDPPYPYGRNQGPSYETKQITYRKPLAIAAPPNNQPNTNRQPNAFGGRNDKGRFEKRFDKGKARAYVAEEQEDGKDINNEGTEDSREAEDQESGSGCGRSRCGLLRSGRI